MWDSAKSIFPLYVVLSCLFASFYSAFSKSNYLVSKYHLNHILVTIPIHKILTPLAKWLLFIDQTNKIL